MLIAWGKISAKFLSLFFPWENDSNNLSLPPQLHQNNLIKLNGNMQTHNIILILKDIWIASEILHWIYLAVKEMINNSPASLREKLPVRCSIDNYISYYFLLCFVENCRNWSAFACQMGWDLRLTIL